MAMQAHMWLEGTDQGKIEGSCDVKGREGSVLVEQFDHNITMEPDRNSGLPTGNPRHEALTVCKYFDKASPKLYKALVRGERFKSVEIKWYRIKPDGKQEHYFTHKLEDAIITGIKPEMKNRLDPQNEQFQHMENVSFAYRKITWTWQPDGIGAEADWKEPSE